MNTIERYGIDSKWSRHWKANCSNNFKWKDTYEQKTLEELEYYVSHGVMLAQSGSPVLPPVSPPRKRWESTYLETNLSMYGRMRLIDLEMNGIAGAFDSSLAVRAFAAIYTDQMIDIYGHNVCSVRFPGRVVQVLDLHHLPYTALGMVVGCKDEALMLARLQLAAYRKRYYRSEVYQYYPISHFMLRILADYLGEPAHIQEGDALTEPVFNALFNVWREPDVDAVAQVSLAACDFHAQPDKVGGEKPYSYDFGYGDWHRFPIEILLLSKLRQLLDLPNPLLDHPLMNTALGRLPEKEISFNEIAKGSDDLIYRVRQRMMQDGYNEEEIAGYYKS